MMASRALRVLLFALSAVPQATRAALPISPARIDATVGRAMQAFQVPGMAVGIVKDGKLIYAKGYGVREVGKPDPVDADTLFQIGSNTKAFTAAALAILVDEGRIKWDDKVIDHLPQFRLYDPYVTREFTIRDLLTHRSGLGTGAGDLMFYPTTDMSRDEIIHGLRFLKPVSGFRSQFDYDNLLYMVAGQIVPAVTGMSWEDFVTDRIFKPLQMTACATNYARIKDRSDFAAPHLVVNGKPQAIPVASIDTVGPAGTINCSINGMSRWLMTQLANGKSPSGAQIFSAAGSAQMWSPNTLLPVDPEVAALTRTHFKAYGLGWGLEDEFGYKRVHHTGGVPGTVTWVSMIPELNLGVLVFTNQQSVAAMNSVGHQILDAYLGAPRRDWVAVTQAYSNKREAEARAVESAAAQTAAAAGPPPLPLSAYAGTYNDPWRGNAKIVSKDDKLVLNIGRTQSLEGTLQTYSGNVFIVRWNDRSLDADAYVRFDQGYDGKIAGMSLKAVSPATDFSFDFQDLSFTKIE